MARKKENDIKIYNPDMYKDELEIIDDDINEIDRLYRDVRNHYESVKNSHARGSLTFVEKQTANLISLKTAKLNFIKEKMNIKSNITNFAIKEKQLDKGNDELGVDGYSKAIFDMISSNFKYDKTDNTNFNKVEIPIDNEDDIDKELDAAIDYKEDDSEDINMEENNLKSSEEDIAVVYCKSLNKFYLVNEDGEIVDDGYEVENYTTSGYRTDEDGTEYLVTDRGDFEVVELSE